MLSLTPDEIESYLREQIEIDLVNAGMDEQRTIMQRALAAALGLSGHGLQPVTFLGVVNREAASLGAVIASAIEKVLTCLPITASDGLTSQALAAFETAFFPIAPQMRSGFGHEREKCRGNPGLDERFWATVNE